MSTIRPVSAPFGHCLAYSRSAVAPVSSVNGARNPAPKHASSARPQGRSGGTDVPAQTGRGTPPKPLISQEAMVAAGRRGCQRRASSGAYHGGAYQSGGDRPAARVTLVA